MWLSYLINRGKGLSYAGDRTCIEMVENENFFYVKIIVLLSWRVTLYTLNLVVCRQDFN